MLIRILKNLADSTPALTPLKHKQRNRPQAIAPIHSVLPGQANSACDTAPKPELTLPLLRPENNCPLGQHLSRIGRPWLVTFSLHDQFDQCHLSRRLPRLAVGAVDQR